MSLVRRIDNPWRKASEIKASAAWFGSAFATMIAGFQVHLPVTPFALAACFSLGMGVLRAKEAFDLLNLKANLIGQPFSLIKSSEVSAKMAANPKKLWLGHGFLWKPIHTQRAMDLLKRDVEELMPPDWFLRMQGKKPEALRDDIGAAWVHGLEPTESDAFVPLVALEGHTLVVGTTGAGKTRAMEVMIYQAVRRLDTVVVIDPKGDDDLRKVVMQACIDNGRPEAYQYFHPAFPSKSIRLDCMKNFNRETELASRVSGLMGSDDQFEDFAWRAVDQVVQAMLFLEARPSLKALRRIIENGPDVLLEKLLTAFLQRNVPNWEARSAVFVAEERGNKQRKIPSAELAGYIRFYQQLPDTTKSGAVDGLMSMTLHSREHLGKILASLMPVLAKLTTGEMGDLLSPDYDDINDPRPIFDTAKLISGKHVVYIGLDSLSDSAVGSAVGSLILADFAAVAGDRYNHGFPKDSRIKLYVDESSEVACNPLVQLLNKGRGAGVEVTLFMQTIADMVVRLGSEAHARQLLGNLNNMIALRTKDRGTQDFVVESIGETSIQKISRGHSTGSKSDDGGMEFSGSISENVSDERTEIFPPALLGRLPNLHYIAMMAGGRLIKGRLSKIVTG